MYTDTSDTDRVQTSEDASVDETARASSEISEVSSMKKLNTHTNTHTHTRCSSSELRLQK